MAGRARQDKTETSARGRGRDGRGGGGLQGVVHNVEGRFLTRVLPVDESTVHKHLQSVLPVRPQGPVAVHLPLLLQPQPQSHLGGQGGRKEGRRQGE